MVSCDGCDQLRACAPFRVGRHTILLCSDCRAEQDERNATAVIHELAAVFYGPRRQRRLTMDDAMEAARGRTSDRR